MVSEIPLTDEFDHPQGRLTYYDAYDLTEQKAIAAQKHVDIRRFIQEDETIGGNVLSLDSNSIETMNGFTMGNVSSGERLLAINRITNPSAEVNATDGGITASNATIARTTTVANVGSASFQLTSVAAGNMSWRHLNGRFSVIAGEVYSAAAQFRAATTARSCRVYIDWYDSAGVRIGSAVAGAAVTNTTTGWTRAIIENRVAPTGAVTAQVIAEVAATGAAGEVHYVDALIAHQGTTVFDYFDGSITAPTNRRVRWTGTAHNSTSELIDTTSGGLLVTAIAGEKWGITNLIGNGGFEDATVGVSNWLGTGTGPLGATSTFSRSTAQAHEGVASMEVVSPSAATTTGVHASLGSIDEGRTLTARVRVRVPTTQSIRLMMQDNILGRGVFTTVTVPANTWTALSVTWTPPVLCANAKIYVFRTTQNLAETWYVDNVIVVDGTIAPAHFDGTYGNDVQKQADRRNWRGISLPLKVGLNISLSVTKAVDIDTDFADSDFISLALPAFPLASVTLADSYVDFTSHPSGKFGVGPTDSIPLSATTIPLVAGDSEFRVPRSTLATVDKKNITGVRFRITATATATFRAMALRLLSADWKYAPVDVDTRYKRLIQTVAPNGSLDRAYDQRYGILWRSSSPPGIGDLQPVDTSLGIVFNSGSMTDTNSFSIYLREKIGVDFLTQLDLNTTPQSELNGNEQPDIGVGKYQPRPQTDLDLYPQSALDPETQTELERMADVLAASWVSATIQWKPSGLTTFILGNSENTVSSGSTHQIDFPGLQPNTRYMVYVDLEEHTFRVRLYALTRSEQVGALLMDSTAITDDFFFKRRKGRIGFDTQFRDGDVYIEGIRSRGSVFAEYRSAPMTSITPVEGAELYVEGSSNQELVKGLEAGPFGGSLSFDTVHTLSGRSTRVANPAGIFGQGVQTNLIEFENFADYELNLDLYYPSGSTALLDFYLISETNNVIQLDLPNINVDRWEHFKIDLAQIKNEVNGAYRLVIIDSRLGITGGWWIEGVSIKRRIINWSARSNTGDPWVDTPGRWTPFQNLVNKQRAGVLFAERGDTLQVRAQAVHPSATISRIRIIPRYASLGRFSWLDQRSQGERPTALWTYTNDGGGAATVTFNGSTSTAIGQIIDYHWNFGDGTTGSGVISKHTYRATGTFTASLTVTDDRGRQNTRMEVIVVT